MKYKAGDYLKVVSGYCAGGIFQVTSIEDGRYYLRPDGGDDDKAYHLEIGREEPGTQPYDPPSLLEPLAIDLINEYRSNG